MRGYVVESFADAPMRPRAWFETLDEAEEYGRKRFGDRSYVHSYELADGAELSAVKADLEELSAAYGESYARTG